ncbi:MAG: Methylglyoxal synthase [Segetibacter sp.]|nr:Methylglyoxal synthase [Segetibacter sp.]
MAEQRKLAVEKRIALVAHDKKKKDLSDWCLTNKDVLAKHELFGTGTTAKMISERLGLPVNTLFSGPLGGDQQIGSMIAEGKLDFLVFFWDPMEAQPHDSDVKALLRLAVAWNIIIANNRTTADFILHSELMKDDYVVTVPDFSKYLSRDLT